MQAQICSVELDLNMYYYTPTNAIGIHSLFHPEFKFPNYLRCTWGHSFEQSNYTW